MEQVLLISVSAQRRRILRSWIKTTYKKRIVGVSLKFLGKLIVKVFVGNILYMRLHRTIVRSDTAARRRENGRSVKREAESRSRQIDAVYFKFLSYL